MKASAIIPAAGLGTRMKSGAPETAGAGRKQFMQLEDVPVLIHTVRKFLACSLVDEVVIALRQEDIEWVAGLVAREASAERVRLVEGGETRQQSVANALGSLGPEAEIVAVHDAVRPFVDVETIEEVIRKAGETGAAIAGVVPVDTVKQVQRHTIRGTLLRDRLVLAQTPQAFRAGILREAFARAAADGFAGTDESSLVERLDQVEVSVVPGSSRNIKITRPADLPLAEFLLAEERRRKAGAAS
jgi:2-C-methyl-D-erythritol 4-phosphate cytidylyltransferase